MDSIMYPNAIFMNILPKRENRFVVRQLNDERDRASYCESVWTPWSFAFNISRAPHINALIMLKVPSSNMWKKHLNLCAFVSWKSLKIWICDIKNFSPVERNNHKKKNIIKTHFSTIASNNKTQPKREKKFVLIEVNK